MQHHRVLSAVLSILVLFFATSTVMADVKEHRLIEGPDKGQFNTPSEVTKKCLECHPQEAEDFMKTQHWRWEQLHVINCEEVLFGKKTALTNFAITLKGNWEHCTSCHDGYGWEDETFNFKDKSKVDCIGCHDTTGTYEKSRKGFGMPVGFEKEKPPGETPVDLLKVARMVDKPTRKSCGRCHFGGCGAARVKHGDLDPSFTSPDYEIDIHMAGDGQNFNCQKCHYPKGKHDIRGHYLAATPEGVYQSGCLECHSNSPHRLEILNTHYEAIACQTCHIPTFARKYAAKTDWDWSTDTRKKRWEATEGGRRVRVHGMGAFTYNKDIIPQYAWFNGCDDVYMLGDKIDPSQITKLNWPLGEKDDPKAKIFPFKVIHGVQIYDKKHNYLITPLITEEAETSFGKNLDWNTAASKGMKINGLPYSGEYGFTDTVQYWRVNHGVVPGDRALDCLECHGHNGRMDWENLGYAGDPWEIEGLCRSKPRFRK